MIIINTVDNKKIYDKSLTQPLAVAQSLPPTTTNYNQFPVHICLNSFTFPVLHAGRSCPVKISVSTHIFSLLSGQQAGRKHTPIKTNWW